MSILLICGSHKRHVSIADTLFKAGLLAGLVIEEREDFIPDPPEGISALDRENFIRHFNKRDIAEKMFFGKADLEAIKKCIPVLHTSAESLNSRKTIDFISEIQTDSSFLFSYGCHMLKPEIIDKYQYGAFNIHGGLSPWFKGTVTLFWPFYFLMPNWAGMTIHRLSNRLDAGDILHHSVPELIRGDGVHDTACRAVLQVGKDIVKILESTKSGKKLECIKQSSNGKLFLNSEWKAQHLRLIYNTFNDDIVDRFLNGELGLTNPPLVDFFKS